MVGNLIRDQFLKARDWPFGAALALSRSIAFLVVLFVLQALVPRASTAAERRVRRRRLALACRFWLTYVFLYMPIVVLVVMSFNAEQVALHLRRASALQWYGELLADERHPRGLRQHADRRRRRDRHRDGARHPARVGLDRYTRSRLLDALVADARRSCPTSSWRSACWSSSRTSA